MRCYYVANGVLGAGSLSVRIELWACGGRWGSTIQGLYGADPWRSSLVYDDPESAARAALLCILERDSSLAGIAVRFLATRPSIPIHGHSLFVSVNRQEIHERSKSQPVLVKASLDRETAVRRIFGHRLQDELMKRCEGRNEVKAAVLGKMLQDPRYATVREEAERLADVILAND